jgi:hypothetical protein
MATPMRGRDNYNLILAVLCYFMKIRNIGPMEDGVMEEWNAFYEEELSVCAFT